MSLTFTECTNLMLGPFFPTNVRIVVLTSYHSSNRCRKVRFWWSAIKRIFHHRVLSVVFLLEVKKAVRVDKVGSLGFYSLRYEIRSSQTSCWRFSSFSNVNQASDYFKLEQASPMTSLLMQKHFCKDLLGSGSNPWINQPWQFENLPIRTER